jgi:hypothetical protein
LRFNPPPNWPVPRGFQPDPHWRPDPRWGPPPPGWWLWIPAIPPRRRLTAGTKVTGILLLVASALIGIATVIVFAVQAISPIVDTLSADSHQTPYTTTRHFDEGTYVVYQRVADSDVDSVSVLATDVTVTSVGEGQQQVGIKPMTRTDRLDINDRDYLGAVKFTIPHAGDYQIAVTSSGSEIVIGRDILDVVYGALPWLFGLLIAVLVLIAGILVLVRGPRRLVGPDGRPVESAPAAG